MNKKDKSAAEGYFADIMTATADNAELCDKNLSLVYAFEKRAEKDALKKEEVTELKKSLDEKEKTIVSLHENMGTLWKTVEV